MKSKKGKSKEKSLWISGIGITSDTLTSRGGLSLFVRYLDAIGIMSIITRFFDSIRKNRKGNGIEKIFKQLLCNFVDGTSRRLVHYDRIKEDAGYAGVICGMYCRKFLLRNLDRTIHIIIGKRKIPRSTHESKIQKRTTVFDNLHYSRS